MVKTSRGILKECNAFYKNLYTEGPTGCKSQDWLLEQLDSTLSSKDQALCKGELTVLVSHTVLSQMESGWLSGRVLFPVLGSPWTGFSGYAQFFYPPGFYFSLTVPGNPAFIVQER